MYFLNLFPGGQSALQSPDVAILDQFVQSHTAFQERVCWPRPPHREGLPACFLLGSSLFPTVFHQEVADSPRIVCPCGLRTVSRVRTNGQIKIARPS